jgi:hypothetical protein
MQITTYDQLVRRIRAYLLPAILAPHTRVLAATQVRHILHHSVHGRAKVFGAFIIHGNDNKQLGLPWRVAQVLPEP